MPHGRSDKKLSRRVVLPFVSLVMMLMACTCSWPSSPEPPTRTGNLDPPYPNLNPQQTQPPPPPQQTQPPPPPQQTQPPLPPLQTQSPQFPPLQTQPLNPTPLDYTLDPNSGTFDLEAGFYPDPTSKWLIAGGDVNVSALNLGPECLGWATAAPDVRVFFSGESLRRALRILFVADNASGDTVLIVNDYAGNWQCNDDLSDTTYNPCSDIPDPNSGYGGMEIWVASYDTGTVAGTLYISELDIDDHDVP